ncbi:MAG: alkaline phosphatase [bacterium]|nr:alkaline phosphatase [bacterium]
MDGFCLLIEGGAVDWASHDGRAGRMIEEMTDFNRAVEAMLAGLDARGLLGDPRRGHRGPRVRPPRRPRAGLRVPHRRSHQLAGAALRARAGQRFARRPRRRHRSRPRTLPRQRRTRRGARRRRRFGRRLAQQPHGRSRGVEHEHRQGRLNVEAPGHLAAQVREDRVRARATEPVRARQRHARQRIEPVDAHEFAVRPRVGQQGRVQHREPGLLPVEDLPGAQTGRHVVGPDQAPPGGDGFPHALDQLLVPDVDAAPLPPGPQPRCRQGDQGQREQRAGHGRTAAASRQRPADAGRRGRGGDQSEREDRQEVGRGVGHAVAERHRAFDQAAGGDRQQ